jgi:hypothetical protein
MPSGILYYAIGYWVQAEEFIDLTQLQITKQKNMPSGFLYFAIGYWEFVEAAD